MTELLRLHAASRTHVGHVRRRNEDSLLHGQWLYAVADGLGGHVAGDIASATAVQAMKTYDRPAEVDDLADTLGRAISDAGEALRRKTREEPGLSGMGTTVVALLWSGATAVVGNVGDSRAYLMRNVGSFANTLDQVSEDHTYQHLVADARAVPYLPEKLARFLDGRRDGRSPDLTTLRLHPGDRILLCSDGLSSYVPPDSVRATLNSAEDPESAADQLVSQALDEGGRDNVTIIVIDVRRASGAGG
ncbi:hypothetical protein GCM10011608_30620 [Micromonospora sonchi]|uniref:PPM-type phosphatase domain-containing protein n=1 Tax=Micromonospora sonchi TaxID=1763543 RepID=A0A917TY16_9ACTN|nr:protein phosphatase 2C domain-containing protein [Micromonospora sonchi]GGM43727.1 hypothetical protein GCM10011608_30620 [Micromonospora sonchi]